MEPTREHAFSYRDGVLCAEAVSLDALAEEHGTPLFVYSHDTLVSRFHRLRRAFAPLEPLIAYSVKANPSLGVIRSLAREGSGADVVSVGELERALLAGVAPGAIVFSGVGKRRDELEAGLAAGIRCFNVEVAEELELLSQLAVARGVVAPIAFRVNPDVDAKTHRHITVGRKVDKFGVPFEQAVALYRRAAELPGVDPRGIDCHIGSQLTQLDPFRQALARIGELVGTLRAQGLAIEWVDVGGGLGVRYRDETPPTIEAYAEVVRDAVSALGCQAILEPGRILAAPAGVLLTEVLYRKQVGEKRFVIVDAAMTDLPRPALYDARHDVWAVRAGTDLVQGDVVGPVCESGDFLAREEQVPDAQVGERICVLGAGAYCRSMTSTYNSRPRAAEVLVRGDEVHLIQRRERLEELWAHERIPEFLGS